MKNSIKSLLSLLLIAVILCGVLFGLNVWAAPKILENEAKAAEAAAAAGQEMLLRLLPGASSFETIYDAQDPGASSLHDVPEAVQTIYAADNGLGYVLALRTSDGYTKEPIEISMGVDREGRISGMEVTAYPAEERDVVGAGLPQEYLGQDSAVPELLVAQMTVSSRAFRSAVLAGFDALIANDLVGAGVKDDSQILREELLPVVAPNLRDGVRELAVDGDTILAGWVNDIKSLAAFIVRDGEDSRLVLANVEGRLLAYDVDGQDVTETLSEAVREKLAVAVSAEIAPFTESDIKKFQRMVGDDAVVEALPLEVVSTVVGVYRITSADGSFYGFAARPRGFAEAILVYYVLDDQGAIVKTSVSSLIQESEYFTAFAGMDDEAYREGFVGQTGETWNEDLALIATATVSSNAMKLATADVFEAFRLLAENGGLDA